MRRYEHFVEIEAPVERVFDMFADFEAAPRWAGGVLDVRRTGRRTFRWVAETALDIDVEWEAEVVVFAPDRRIVWRSVGGDIRADCEAVFSITPDGTTLLRVVRGYDTPGGRTGRAVARFFGRHPEEQLDEDLAHLKRLAERSRRMGGRRVPRVVRVERRERDEPRRGLYEEPRVRHALTPREREREREREWHARRAEEEAREMRAAGRYLHRGVDRLLERPPEDWRRRRD
ncbi:MAG: SRPBCC family protein [Pyrinomonadaceae bacterium]